MALVNRMCCVLAGAKCSLHKVPHWMATLTRFSCADIMCVRAMLSGWSGSGSVGGGGRAVPTEESSACSRPRVDWRLVGCRLVVHRRIDR